MCNTLAVSSLEQGPGRVTKLRWKQAPEHVVCHLTEQWRYRGAVLDEKTRKNANATTRTVPKSRSVDLSISINFCGRLTTAHSPPATTVNTHSASHVCLSVAAEKDGDGLLPPTDFVHAETYK